MHGTFGTGNGIDCQTLFMISDMEIDDKKYIGRPCQHGHSGLRYKANALCVECALLRSKEKGKTKEYREYQRKYQSNFRQKPDQKTRAYEYNRSKSGKLSVQKYASSGKGRAKNRNYALTKRKSMPNWLNKDQLSAISAIYAVGSILKMDVDHIEPLRGKDRCGLHVPWNLQLLSRSENRQKSNRTDYLE